MQRVWKLRRSYPNRASALAGHRLKPAKLTQNSSVCIKHVMITRSLTKSSEQTMPYGVFLQTYIRVPFTMHGQTPGRPQPELPRRDAFSLDYGGIEAMIAKP